MDGFQNSQYEHWRPNNDANSPLAAQVPSTLLPTVLQRLGLENASMRSSVLEDLYSSDWQKRVAAIHTPDAAQVPLPLLLAALDDEDAAVRATALHSLGEHLPLNRLLTALHDTDWHVRETAVFALKQQKQSITSELLASALQDTDSSVREAAQLVQQWLRSQPTNTHTTAITHDDFSTLPMATNTRQQQIMQMQPAEPVEEKPLLIKKDTSNHSMRKKGQEKMMQEQENEQIRNQEEERVPDYGYYEGYHGPSAHWEKATSFPAQQYPLPERKGVVVPVSILVISAFMLVIALGGTFTWLALVRRSASSSKIIQAVNKSAFPTVMPKPAMTPGSDSATVYTYHGHANVVYAVAWSPDGTRVASASEDGTVQVWDATTGNNVVIHRGLPSYSTIAWSPNGQYIASALASNSTVEVWNAATGKTTSTYQLQPAAADVSHIGALSRLSGGCNTGVYKVAWSPDGKSLAVAGGYQSHGLIEIFDVQSGRVLLANNSYPNCVSALSWSPDGKYIVSGSFDGMLNTWNAKTGQLVASYSAGTSSMVEDAVWSPNSQNIALSLTVVGGVNIWNPFTQRNFTFDAGEDIFQIAWSPDGQRLATASPDTTVHVWDAQSGEALSVYTGHTKEVFAVAWSPKENLIASAGMDDTVQVWKA